jgi:phage major head subunit gpT-like protein
VAPNLEFVGEGGEFKHGTMAESQETIILQTFGKIFAMSRQSLVNDDLGAFTDEPRLFGVAAREFEDSALVAKIIANPVMSDGIAVFDTAHGNTSTGPAINIASLSVARVSMRKQKGSSGMPIDVTPRFVLVPPELETAAEQQLTELQATQSDNVNPFAKLTLVVEPRLTSATR